MEYAIGKVSYIRETYGRIQVLFRLKNNFWTQNSIQGMFPPDGYVFAPNCGVDYPLLKPGMLVVFNCIPNEQLTINDGAKDQYIVQMKNRGGMIRPLVKIFNINMQKIYNREQIINSNESIFFIQKQKSVFYLCGPLNGKDLSPRKGKEVGAWQYVSNRDTIYYDGQNYLVTDIGEFTKEIPAFMVDCMSTEQLYNDWLKKQFNFLGSHHVLEHIHQQLKEIESKASDVLAKERFQRIFRTLDFLNLSYEEIKHLSEIPEFQKIYKTTVEKLLEEKHSEISKEIEDQLAKKKLECQESISKLESELENQLVQKEREYHNRLFELDTKEQQYSKRTAELNEKIARLEEACASKEESLELLEKNKREFVEMIRLQADLVGGSAR